MLTENDIAGIASRIVRGYGPLAAGIFGSYAIGRARDRSDLDLFVIKRTPERPTVRKHTVKRLLHGIMYPLDVHVFTPEEFEESAKEYLSFTWVIARQARLFYWSEEAGSQVPSLNPQSTPPANGCSGLERFLPTLHPPADSGNRSGSFPSNHSLTASDEVHR